MTVQDEIGYKDIITEHGDSISKDTFTVQKDYSTRRAFTPQDDYVGKETTAVQGNFKRSYQYRTKCVRGPPDLWPNKKQAKRCSTAFQECCQTDRYALRYQRLSFSFLQIPIPNHPLYFLFRCPNRNEISTSFYQSANYNLNDF